MKLLPILFAVLFSGFVQAQKVTISGTASDSSNGTFAVEVVINDTLSKLMKHPKDGKQKYLKMYQDKNFVVRTDSTGRFSIKAHRSDSLYFKSYRHKTQAYLVDDLMQRKQINIKLLPDPDED